MIHRLYDVNKIINLVCLIVLIPLNTRDSFILNI